MLRKTVKVSAPGKIILTGEHAVVYGYPAILAAVNRRLVVEGRRNCGQTEIKVLKSDIPIGAGMGSSAALSVAAATAKTVIENKKWNLDTINSIAYESEKNYHRNPSGADNTAVTYGGFLWYRKETENFKLFKQIIPKIEMPKFFLVNSGTPKETTGDMVSRVAKMYATSPKKFLGLLTQIEKIAREFLKLLIDGNRDWVELIKENERCLEFLGIVSVQGKNLIRKLEKIGAIAKISGAGGVAAGSGMVLVYHPDEEKLRSFCQDNNLEVFSVKLGEEGVRIEK